MESAVAQVICHHMVAPDVFTNTQLLIAMTWGEIAPTLFAGLAVLVLFHHLCRWAVRVIK